MIRFLNRRLTIASLFLSAVFSFSVTSADQTGRFVEGNVVISEANPRLAIKVDSSFSYLGKHSIKIRDVAAGERIVFAQMDDATIEKMLILQFEGFLPSMPNETYRYDFSGKPLVAGYPFRSNAFAFDLPKARSENPGNESADTATFLEIRGLTPPKTWMMWRSLTVELPERRDELIIFYVENGDLQRIDIDDIYDPETDQSKDFWRQFMVGLEARANASFKLTTMDGKAGQLGGVWQTVPKLLSDN